MKLIIFPVIIAIVFLLVRLAVTWASASPQFAPLASAPNASRVALLPCPGIKPNCHYQSIPVQGSMDEALTKVQQALESMSGTTIEHVEPGYLYATNKTRIMGYIDDIECLMNEKGKKLDCRSASRLGHSDLGKNKKRLDEMFALTGEL